MVLTIYSWVANNGDFNVISVLGDQAFLCNLSVRHLYSVITQRTGTEENLQLCLQTLLQREGEREQMLSWRVALLTTLTQRTEGSCAATGTLGLWDLPCSIQASWSCSHPSRVPSMSCSCRDTQNCTGRLGK